MQPLNDYVVIELIDLEKDKLIKLSTDAENQPVGKVIAVGPGRPLEQLIKHTVVENGFEVDDGCLVPARAPMSVKKGDVVIFYKGAAQKIEISNKEYYVMSETNIFLILNSNIKDTNDDRN